MGHQPEYCQPHSHEQTEPVPVFDLAREGRITFRQSACRILIYPVQLMSHIITAL